MIHIPNRQIFPESCTRTQPSPSSTAALSSAPAAITDSQPLNHGKQVLAAATIQWCDQSLLCTSSWSQSSPSPISSPSPAVALFSSLHREQEAAGVRVHHQSLQFLSHFEHAGQQQQRNCFLQAIGYSSSNILLFPTEVALVVATPKGHH